MLTSSGTTKRLDKLEQAGLIAREPDPQDRRGVLIALTDKGREAIDATTAAHLANERRLLAVLSDDRAAPARRPVAQAPARPARLMEITLFTDPACPFAFSAEPEPVAAALALRRPAHLAAADDRADPGARRGGEARAGRADPAAPLRDADRSRAVPASRLVRTGVPRGGGGAAERARRRGGAAAAPARAGDGRRAARRPGADRGRGDRRRPRSRSSSTAGARRPPCRTRSTRTSAPRARPRPPRGRSTTSSADHPRSAATPRRATRSAASRCPGSIPVEAYEAAIANVAPELTRRPKPESVEELLAWAGEPLATAEIHTIIGGDPAKLRAALARVAQPIPSGADCFWRL